MTRRVPRVERGALRNHQPPCLSYHVLFHITADTPAVTVCVFDILTVTEKEQVFGISATILFRPSCGKKC